MTFFFSNGTKDFASHSDETRIRTCASKFFASTWARTSRCRPTCFALHSVSCSVNAVMSLCPREKFTLVVPALQTQSVVRCAKTLPRAFQRHREILTTNSRISMLNRHNHRISPFHSFGLPRLLSDAAQLPGSDTCGDGTPLLTGRQPLGPEAQMPQSVKTGLPQIEHVYAVCPLLRGVHLGTDQQMPCRDTSRFQCFCAVTHNRSSQKGVPKPFGQDACCG